jgi:dTDP-4-dehydrorhamnose reductase
MRIAVTGSGGGVGRAFLRSAPAHHDVTAFTHDDLPVEDRHQVMRALAAAEPEAILHLAAMTAVDGCEQDPERAFAMNALGTRNVALAGREVGAVVVYLSTDYVFDGEKEAAYHEFDRTNPRSVYGASKLAGEAEVRRHAGEHLVVRTSWLFGGGDDYVSRALGQLAAGETAGGVVDRTGTPTFVPHLAGLLPRLIVSGIRGTVHVAGPETTTWFDLLERAKRLGGLTGEVVEQKSADLGLPAPRPSNSALKSLVLSEEHALPPLDDAIRDHLETTG